jgi:hypothetical protein
MKYDPEALTRHVLDCAQQALLDVLKREMQKTQPSD